MGKRNNSRKSKIKNGNNQATSKGKSIWRLFWRFITLRRLLWIWQIILTIILTAIIRVLFWLFNIDISTAAQVPVTVGLLLLTAVISQILVSFIILARLGEILEKLLEVEEQAKQPARSVLRAFMINDLRGLQETLIGVLSEQGRIMDPRTAQFWTRTCFEAADAPYDGTDSHVPSDFLNIYEGYLESHSINLKKTKTSGSRILITTKQDLYDDFVKDNPNSHPFKNFWDWHEKTIEGQKVSLLYIDTNRAKELMKRYNLDTVDIGIWRNRFVLLFNPMEEGIKFRMVLNGDKLYESAVEFFNALRKEALPIKYPPNLFEPELANKWYEFVEPVARLNQERDFLRDILEISKDSRSQYRNIFDAAAGIGVESLFLQQEGLFVTSNEIDEHLRENANKYVKSRSHDASLLFTTHDWRNLASYTGPEYDAVLVLGNSLCLVLKHEDRIDCIKGFAHMLRPGGILIVDERNFPRILKLKESIIDNPLQNFPFNGTMYCGSSVLGCPIHIDDNKIIFVYHANHEVDDWDSLKKPGVIYGTLDMYPFKENEINDLLINNGFNNIRKYSDFKPEYNPDADFYTYIATKK